MPSPKKGSDGFRENSNRSTASKSSSQRHRFDKVLGCLERTANNRTTAEDITDLLARKTTKAEKDRAEGVLNDSKLKKLARAAAASLKALSIPDIDALISLFQRNEVVKIAEPDLTALLKTPIDKINIKKSEQQIAAILAKFAETGSDQLIKYQAQQLERVVINTLGIPADHKNRDKVTQLTYD